MNAERKGSIGRRSAHRFSSHGDAASTRVESGEIQGDGGGVGVRTGVGQGVTVGNKVPNEGANTFSPSHCNARRNRLSPAHRLGHFNLDA